MIYSVKKILASMGFVLAITLTAVSQDVKRDLRSGNGAEFEIVNKHGRITVKTAASGFGLVATSPRGVSDSEIKISNARGRNVATVTSSDKQKRIDITLSLPERSKLKVETVAGSIDVSGDFSSVDGKTETGTISLDVPADDLRYFFQWTESRPRFLADFELSEVKERSAGRFEIKGHWVADSKKVGPDKGVENGLKLGISEDADSKISAVSLSLTTARGIILINVPPGEVTNDLRERPLTSAAKAIIRSGDSLLMEAIRRSAPKYFGDYARSLPPLRLEPSFAAKTAQPVGLNSPVKTALVRVTDIDYRSISGLSARDFEVLEGGISREILSVERSDAPFNLVLLLDVSGSVENYVNFIRKAARNFVETVGADDRVSIVIFNEDIKVLSTFTTDKGKLSTSLDEFDAGGGTAYYDALAYTIADTLRPLKGGRTAIVILTDGDDNRSFLAFDSLTGSIQESGALIYPLYVPSGLIALAAQNIKTDIDPLRKKYMSLTAKSAGEGEKLAKLSGGVYYPITQIGQIQKAYEDIVVQMRSAYKITFRSDSVLSSIGSSSRLKIKAKGENAFTTVTAVTAAVVP